MRRRTFVCFLGGAAVTWPFAARAQQPAMPVIGFLCGKSAEGDASDVAATWKGLNEIGFVEEQNVRTRYLWAENQYDRFPALAGRLARSQVAVVAAIGTTPAALAMKAATTTLPVVFIVGADPVKLGLVASLNRPGRNMTGVSFLNRTIVAKQIELLRETIPKAATIGFLVNPHNPYFASDTSDARAAAASFGLKLLVVEGGTESDLEAALDTLAQQQVGGFLVAGDLFLNGQQKEIVMFAARNALPAIYPWREAVAADGLMSYGASLTDAYRLAGRYLGRILKGEKPADLPVQQSTRVELVINLKTANALGLTMSPALLARADEVIE